VKPPAPHTCGTSTSAANISAFSATLSTNQRIPGRLAGYAD
jgi:hypothetical protein